MSKKFDKELMQLDLYELLDLSIDANESQIKKSYRKKALKCHPDKNLNNPLAVEEFHNLKKTLEILLDPGARSAYDKLLKSRKSAAIRAKELNAKSQIFKNKLEEREQKNAHPRLSEEERLRRELKRLEQEGDKLIEEELARVNETVKAEMKNAGSVNLPPSANASGTHVLKSFKVKVKWYSTKDWSGYTEKELHQLFYKWGEINAVVMKQKGKKGTALIDYKLHSGADMAVKFEKGLSGKPVEVKHVQSKPASTPKINNTHDPDSEARAKSASFNFESIAEMNRRREAERRRLIEEMLKEEESIKA